MNNITNQPTNYGKFIMGVGFVLLAAFLVVALGGPTTPETETRTKTPVTYRLDQAAKLKDDTTINIVDVREVQHALSDPTTNIKITYTAGDAGHHPTHEPPTLTDNNGETHHPQEGFFTITSAGLAEPLAPGIQKTLTIAYETPLHTLTNAQINIDGKLFAGDFTRRISNG